MAAKPENLSSTSQADVGGFITDDPIDLSPHPLTHWEKSIHAVVAILSMKKPKALLNFDELRRAIEGLEVIFNAAFLCVISIKILLL